MKKVIALLLALVLLFTGCELANIENIDDLNDGTEETEKPKADTSVFGVAYAKGESADPYTSNSRINTELVSLICEPLFSAGTNFEANPILCESFSHDGLTYRFQIKRNIPFSDGSTLSPSDVEYSLKLAASSGSYYAQRLSDVASVSSSNRGGYVQITLKRENGRFPVLLDIPIIKKGTENNALPTGTGLYAPNAELTKLSFREGHHLGKKPPYKEISLVSVGNTDELIFEFETHRVSVLSSDPTGTSAISLRSAAEPVHVTSTIMHYLGFNVRKEPLNNPEVRRAISRAIDRNGIAENDFALMGVPAVLPLHPKSSNYSSEIGASLEYSQNATVPTDKPLTILVNNESSAKVAAASQIAENLTRIGVSATVRAVPFSEYNSALYSGDFTLYYGEISLGADFDITKLIVSGLNFGGFYDESLSSLNSSYLAADEASADFYKKFCELLPFAPILFKDTAMYTQEGFWEEAYPTSQNLYNSFCDWKTGG